MINQKGAEREKYGSPHTTVTQRSFCDSFRHLWLQSGLKKAAGPSLSGYKLVLTVSRVSATRQTGLNQFRLKKRKKKQIK